MEHLGALGWSSFGLWICSFVVLTRPSAAGFVTSFRLRSQMSFRHPEEVSEGQRSLMSQNLGYPNDDTPLKSLKEIETTDKRGPAICSLGHRLGLLRQYPENRSNGGFLLTLGCESGKWQSAKGSSLALSGYYMHGSQVAFAKP
jgi:hypothetical protein